MSDAVAMALLRAFDAAEGERVRGIVIGAVDEACRNAVNATVNHEVDLAVLYRDLDP